jgi:hypothetical protein
VLHTKKELFALFFYFIKNQIIKVQKKEEAELFVFSAAGFVVVVPMLRFLVLGLALLNIVACHSR